MRARLALLLASTLLALGLTEGGLRVARPLWAIPYPPRSYRPLLFERWDCCGFRARRKLGGRDPRPRVLVLGDSMIFGPGVEEPDRVTERLEAAEPGWRVDNLGMVGFGPDLMLRVLEAKGLATHPAVVVLVMFSHDVYRVVPEMVGA